MPRLTEASRRARRDAIADAALQVFERRGVAHASTADIIDELGGSAGGMYSHFASKAELVRFMAERVLGTGFEAILSASTTPASPTTILRRALSEIAESAPSGLIVQLWGEATIDPEMRQVVHDTLNRIEHSLRDAVLPWAQTTPGDSDALASRTARAMRAFTQGYLVQLALFGRSDGKQYLEDLATVLSEGD